MLRGRVGAACRVAGWAGTYGADVVAKGGAGAEGVDAFDGDAAKGEIIGELPIGDGEGGQVVAEPVCEDVHGRFPV